MTTQSLHKGLRRELPHIIHQTGILNKERLPSPPKTNSRAKNYKTMCKAMLQYFDGLMIHMQEYMPARKKDGALVFLALNTLRGSPGTIVIGRYTVTYRNPHLPVIEELKIYPSNHAIERIYQRKHTTDHGDAIQELNAPIVFFMACNDLEAGQFWEVGTGQGMAIIAINDDPAEDNSIKAVILTWVSVDQLRPGQSAEYMRVRQITVDNEPLSESIQVPMELQFLNKK